MAHDHHTNSAPSRPLESRHSTLALSEVCPPAIARWAADPRSHPGSTLLSACFGPDPESHSAKRPWHYTGLLRFDDFVVGYTGPQLYRADLEVCRALWRFAASNGPLLRLTPPWLLRALGTPHAESARVLEVLYTLVRGMFVVEGGHDEAASSLYKGSILRSVDVYTARWDILVDPTVAALMGAR